MQSSSTSSTREHHPNPNPNPNIDAIDTLQSSTTCMRSVDHVPPEQQQLLFSSLLFPRFHAVCLCCCSPNRPRFFPLPGSSFAKPCALPACDELAEQDEIYKVRELTLKQEIAELQERARQLQVGEGEGLNRKPQM